ncbi:hypothetical protein [Actinomadura sp. 9N407]|uniref:hypothetical protein n=1 Tax=Actinomadura sp. 9N407 TaxID=3375154 RepID=UPI00379F276E
MGSAFACEYFFQGEIRGRAQVLLDTLSRRGLSPSAENRSRIEACTDLVEVTGWLQKAITAEAIDEVFGQE